MMADLFGFIGKNQGEIVLGEGVMKLRPEFEPMNSFGFTLRNSDSKMVHISEVACSHATSLLCRLAKELNCESRVLAHSEAPGVSDTEINLCTNKSASHGALEPQSRASGIPLHADSRLIEVASLLLSAWISGVRGLLVPVGGLFLVTRHTATRKVNGSKCDFLLDFPPLCTGFNAGDIGVDCVRHSRLGKRKRGRYDDEGKND